MQESFTKLRELKGEIESIQRLLEKARTKLQQEFDDWCVLGANTMDHWRIWLGHRPCLTNGHGQGP